MTSNGNRVTITTIDAIENDRRKSLIIIKKKHHYSETKISIFTREPISILYMMSPGDYWIPRSIPKIYTMKSFNTSLAICLRHEPLLLSHMCKRRYGRLNPLFRRFPDHNGLWCICGFSSRCFLDPISSRKWLLNNAFGTTKPWYNGKWKT